MSKRITVTVPDELKERIDMFNEKHPLNPVNMSALVQSCLRSFLDENE